MIVCNACQKQVMDNTPHVVMPVVGAPTLHYHVWCYPVQVTQDAGK